MASIAGRTMTLKTAFALGKCFASFQIDSVRSRVCKYAEEKKSKTELCNRSLGNAPGKQDARSWSLPLLSRVQRPNCTGAESLAISTKCPILAESNTTFPSKSDPNAQILTVRNESVNCRSIFPGWRAKSAALPGRQPANYGHSRQVARRAP